MPTQTYTGGCHCGALKYEVDLDLDQGSIRCNCSLCSKDRAWLAFAPEGNFRMLKGGANDEIHYRWTPPGKSKPNITYHICSTCGVRTHGEGIGPSGQPTAAVMLSTLEDADPALLAKNIRYVDGLHDRFDREPDHIDAL